MSFVTFFFLNEKVFLYQFHSYVRYNKITKHSNYYFNLSSTKSDRVLADLQKRLFVSYSSIFILIQVFI